MEGYNGRMDNLQGAALRAKLVYLDSWNKSRQAIAKLYQQELSEVEPIILPDVIDYKAHVFHVFVILVPEPQKLSDYLKEKNIRNSKEKSSNT